LIELTRRIQLTEPEGIHVKPTYLIWPALLALITLGLGCSSIRTEHLERDLDLCGWKKTHLHGIPITLSVPHHFEVSIIETYYEIQGSIVREVSADPKVNGPPVVTREVQLEVKDTKEIFTVDFVKPASGTLDTKVELDPNAQYFKTINNTIVDTTISDIANSIKTLSGAISPLAKGARALQIDSRLTPHPRVVAMAVVEIADPHAKEKIHDFLCQHLNGCSTCATRAGERPPAADLLIPVAAPNPVVSGTPIPGITHGQESPSSRFGTPK
jgi:hypothetical protein